MSIVLTILVKDEADIIRDNVLFHLSQGVDEIIVTDNGSSDGTVEIVEQFVGRGVSRLIHEPDQNYEQAVWVTRMAAIARGELRADWIISCDADEFWYHPLGLRGALAGRSALQRCFRRNFLPAEEQGAPVHVMLDVIVKNGSSATPETLDDYLFAQLGPKVVCPAAGLKAVAMGNHHADYEVPQTIEDLTDLTIYHYPLRSFAQFERKVVDGTQALERNPNLSPQTVWHWRQWFAEYKAGRLRESYERMSRSPEERARLKLSGAIVTDTTVSDICSLAMK